MTNMPPMEYNECPICLDSMSEEDKRYPLLCPTECRYNFCLSCVVHLVESSKDDYQYASDGNRHVKVRLQCPQCRGDLSHTIQDTLLLRKAMRATKYTDIPDSELTATELVLKHEFLEKYALDVEHAEARLRKFQRDHGETQLTESLHLVKSASSDGGDAKKPFIDTTLFGGLEYAMTESEQAYVTRLMTSGDAQQLAQAAHILHGIMQISLSGLTPSMKAAIGKEPTSKYDRIVERKHLEALEGFRKRYPLPARMPKFVVLKPFPSSKKTVVFEDDEWDGSIADAFVRVQVRNNKLNPGVDKILELADSPQLQEEPEARIKIASVRGHAGRSGLQKGDVVTHFNGEPFTGKAEQLTELIQDMFHDEDADDMFQLVVNADKSTAEALRLRSMACKEAMKGHNLR